MAVSAADRQAAYRERRQKDLLALQREADTLRTEVDLLRAKVAALSAKVRHSVSKTLS